MVLEEKKKKRTCCIRCGTCCKKGGPALHQEDAALFRKGILDRIHVYTLRQGEMVRDLDETLRVINHEIIKIKGQATLWTCRFFDEKESACTIYHDRPIECRALKCWDTRDFNDVRKRPYLKRRDLLNANDGILNIMEAHEKRCAYKLLESATKQLKGCDSDKAAAKILDLVNYDGFIRPFLAEKLNLNPEMMDFFFGRPLGTTIGMFGLAVKEEGDTLFLVPTETRGKVWA
jgi:Fe-S-cluster containining protein